ncbi:MAG: hypothetical protein LBK03_02640, partial [Bacteroidales bacterium]|nr:hypothetical protein [Bacteroidales bacterium]
MKKQLSLIILGIALLLGSVSAHNSDTLYSCAHHSTCWGELVSTEHQAVTNPFAVALRLFCADTTIIYGIETQLPLKWTARELSSPVTGRHLPGKSLALDFAVMLPDISQLPFYAQHIEFQVIIDTTGAADKRISVGGYIYFTPYGTIEIWDMEDFTHLKRAWLEPQVPEPRR